MIIPSEKIRVFISSACGKDEEKHKYNLVRVGLKALIESTQMAKVYIFESEGASTNTAGQHYTYVLEKADVCIFLIDNKDGVFPGVQSEINIVDKHSIKSLYYFCDQYSKQETPLQKSLEGACFAKSKVVHSFEDFITHGAKDLIEDLVLIYKQYCKEYLSSSFVPGSSENISDAHTLGSELVINAEVLLPEEVLSKIDKCKNYFSEMILKQTIGTINNHSFDNICSEFLPILFEGEPIGKFKLDSFLAEVKKQQPSKCFSVIEKRWLAINEYYLGNLDGCINFLKEALELAKTEEMPDWLIKDILIDLRNQSSSLARSRNEYLGDNPYQKELIDSDYSSYYPILDRFCSDFYEKLAKDSMQAKLKSPNTIIIFQSLQGYIDNLTSSFVVSMFNGSLAHMNMLYSKILSLSFYCSEKFSGWEFKTLMLKTAIFSYNTKNIKSITEHFDEILCKMNAADAKEIFDFSNNMPIAYQRFLVQLEAIGVTGYFMSDAQFEEAWGEIYKKIIDWIEGENSCVIFGSYIYKAILNVSYRIKMEDIISVCYKSIQRNMRIFYDEVFEIIYMFIDIKDLQNESTTKLLDCIIEIVSSGGERKNIKYFDEVISSLRQQNKKATENLNAAVLKFMPEFYENNYKLETSVDKATVLPFFISKYIKNAKERNKDPSVGGTYIVSIEHSFSIIMNILKQADIAFEDEQINLVFKTACETLLERKQDLNEKIAAIDLMIYLSKAFPFTLTKNADIITTVKQDKTGVEVEPTRLSNLSQARLRFSLLILNICLGENMSTEIMELLAVFGDDTISQIHASKTIQLLLEADESTQLDLQLEAIILQNALNWCNSKNRTIRRHAIKILFLLLRNSGYSNIICSQLVKRMDNDNVYIKNSILRKLELIKDIDSATYNYILQKASVDTNYVVRQVCEEIKINKLRYQSIPF